MMTRFGIRWLTGILLMLGLSAGAFAQLGPRPNIVPLRKPHFVPASQANFMKSADQVLAVNLNGIAKAYWAPAVAYHHIIDDRIGDIPIMVTW